jgi:hypothetical protein
MLGRAAEGARQVGLELVEGRQPVALELVAQVIRQAREAVDREQVAAQLAGQQAQSNGEVLSARPREDRLGRAAG